MSSKSRFYSEKIKDLNFKEIIYLEFEAWFLWISDFFPGLVGMFLRSLFLKCILKKSAGLPLTQRRVTFVYSNRIIVGKYLGINSGTYINGKGTIQMGDFVLIGSNVTISSGIHPIDRTDIPIFSRPTVPKPIIIEDDVWIGAGAVILPGVRLRKGTVVGANSIVNKDTEEYSVVVGAPAKKIRSRLMLDKKEVI